ncbi:MAG: hypothetical protein ACFB0B_00795 [Thermonemataceae bacterium]
MRKYFTLVILSFLFFTACNNDNEEATVDPDPLADVGDVDTDPLQNRCRMTVIEETEGENKKITQTFTYDESGNVVKWELDERGAAAISYSTYEYDEQNRLVKEMQYEGDNPTPVESSTIVYESEATILVKNEEGETSTTYTLNEAGRITKVDFGSGEYERYEYDENGNITKRFGNTDFPPYEAVEKEYVRYDDKKNKYTTLPDNFRLIFAISVNNVLEEKSYFNGGGENKLDGTSTYTYEYNDEGFPTKRTEKYEDTDSDFTIEAVFVNTYNCE